MLPIEQYWVLSVGDRLHIQYGLALQDISMSSCHNWKNWQPQVFVLPYVWLTVASWMGVVLYYNRTSPYQLNHWKGQRLWISLFFSLYSGVIFTPFLGNCMDTDNPRRSWVRVPADTSMDTHQGIHVLVYSWIQNPWIWSWYKKGWENAFFHDFSCLFDFYWLKYLSSGHNVN